MFSKNKKTIGMLLAFFCAAVSGLFPVMVNAGLKDIPPLMFAGVCSLMAAAGALFYSIKEKKLFEIKDKSTHFDLLMISLCIIIIPQILFFIGASKTSGANASFLLLAEVIFTLVFASYNGEKNTFYKYLGASGILLGSFVIMYNGSYHFNIGDLLIILSTASFPIGSHFTKHALKRISSPTIILVRYLFGGAFILALSLFTENYINFETIWSHDWLFFLLNGIIFLGLGALLYTEALKRLDIYKVVAISMTSPIFSAIALLALGEKISLYQFVGMLIMFSGIYFSIIKHPLRPQLVKFIRI